jgi:hypothetical protein
MMIKLFGATFVLLFLSLTAVQAIQSEPSVEILIPKGMPITMEFKRDKSEPEILKYIFTRGVKNARRARITFAMLDANGSIKFTRSREGDHLNDPMTIATADTSVVRILLIVEWIETDKGKWVWDTKAQALDISLLAKSGAKALPNATFIAKQGK